MNMHPLLLADTLDVVKSFDEHWIFAFCAAFGTIAASIAGAIASCRVRMDVFGIIVCGTIAALGGGTLRDLLLHGHHKMDGSPVMVFWMTPEEDKYLYYSIFTSLAVFYITRFLKPPVGTIRVADAFAMAFFTLLGVTKAYACGCPWFISVLMGVCTGVAGGAVRDMLTGNVPYVFRPGELYATASLAGGCIYIALQSLNFSYPSSFIAGVAVAFFFRMAAVYLNWKLPSYRPLFESEYHFEGESEAPAQSTNTPTKPAFIKNHPNLFTTLFPFLRSAESTRALDSTPEHTTPPPSQQEAPKTDTDTHPQ